VITSDGVSFLTDVRVFGALLEGVTVDCVASLEWLRQPDDVKTTTRMVRLIVSLIDDVQMRARVPACETCHKLPAHFETVVTQLPAGELSHVLGTLDRRHEARLRDGGAAAPPDSRAHVLRRHCIRRGARRRAEGDHRAPNGSDAE